MEKGREEAHVHLLERPFLRDEDTEEGVVLVLEVPDLWEDFLECSFLDRRLGGRRVRRRTRTLRELGTAWSAGFTSVGWAVEGFETIGTGWGVKSSAIAVEVTGATEGGASRDREVWVIWDITALRASTRGMRFLWWRTKIHFSAIYLGQLDEEAAWGVLQWKQRDSLEQVLGL